MGYEAYPLPDDEGGRLQELSSHDLLDTAPEQEFDRLVDLACRIYDVPMAAMSLVDSDRQFFKARIGLAPRETGRDLSFCAHTILSDDILVVPNALLDVRFCSNDLVLGSPHIRFYAGAPLIASSGHRVGSICIIDSKPREGLSDEERLTLRGLADMAMDRMEQRRRRTGDARFRAGAETSPDAIVYADADGLITFWNAAAERMFGYPPRRALGKPLEIVVPERMRAAHAAGLNHVGATGGAARGAHRAVELTARRCDGTQFQVEVALSSWLEDGRPAFCAIVRDITERKKTEARLVRLSGLDPLTRLDNRSSLRISFEEEARRNRPLALLLIGLDGVRDVNDTLGHAVGNTILKAIATRLRVGTGSPNIVARVGGNDFAVLMPGIDDPLRAMAFGNHMIRLIEEPLEHDGHILHLSAGVGITLSGGGGKADLEEMLGEGDLALSGAKADSPSRCRMFTPDLKEAALKRRILSDELLCAAEEAAFELHYQPQVALSDGALTGAEALIRWRHPGRGMLAPGAFLPVLESGPQAAAVGTWVLRTACAQAAVWRREGLPDFRMAVNLFAAQLKAPDFAEIVQKALADFRLPPEALEIEITENIVLRNEPRMIETLRRLRQAGVGIAFDDYGTGFASLSLLKSYPLTRLKIDRSFTTDLGKNPGDRAVVGAVLCLARGFGLAVTAEGIETPEQAAYLGTAGCEEGQGYFYGRPEPAEAFAKRFFKPRVRPARTAQASR